MNKRIKELEKQAYDFANSIVLPDSHNNAACSWHRRVAFNEKFAELIVRECTERLLHDVKLTDIRTSRCVASINEHFGVEE